MADEIASLGFKVDSSGLVKADQRLDRVTESGKRTERQNDITSGSFTRMSKAVGVATAALAGLGVGFNVVNDVINFDRALTELQATSRASAADMQKLEIQSRSLGATTQFSATQVAEAQRFLSQAGFDVNEILKSTSQTLKLATAGNLDVAEAADIASNAMGGLGLEVDNFSKIVDVMAEAASSSNTDVRQLASALSNAAPVATAAGISMEELTAAIGALSDAGIPAERAGTAMVGIIRQLSNVTPAAKKVLKDYSIALEDVNIQSVGLANALDVIGKANLTAGEGIQVFGSEAAAAGIKLSSMTRKIEEQTLRLQQSAGSADEMASIMNSSLTNAAKGLGSALSEVSLIAGDNGLNGVMKSLIVNATGFTHVYTGMLDEFTESSGLTQEFATNMRSASSALEAMIAVMGAGALIKFAPIMYTSAASTALTVKNMLSLNAVTYKTTAGFAGLGGTVTRTSAAMTAFGAASRFALGPWGLLITAVGAAAATFISTKDEAETLTDAIDEQAKYVRRITEDYKEMNKQGQDIFWMKSQNQISGFLDQIINIDDRISKLNKTMSSADPSSRQDIRERIESLKEQREELQSEIEKIRAAQQKIFEQGMPSEWINPKESGYEFGDSGTGEGAEEVNKQIRALKQLQAEIGMTSDELFVYRQQQKAIAQENGAVDQVTALSNAIVQARKTLKFDEQISELSSLQEQVGKTSDELFVLNQVTSAKEAGFSDEQIARVREMAEGLVDLRKGANEASEYERWVESVNNSHRSISDMTAEINKLKEAIEMGDVDPEAGKAAIKEIREEVDRLTESKSLSDMFADGMSAAQQGAMAMREFAEQGTKEYERLTRAAQAFGVAQSLATGNYLGAIAGAASLISSLGSYDFEDISAQVQANQNLNVWGEKSESIDRSTQITANATEKLVGINTDMLKAFQGMSDKIAGAAGLIARDTNPAKVDIGGLGIKDNVLSFLTDSPLTATFDALSFGLFDMVFDAIGGFLGGSSKVVDEGVRIFGGALNDLMEEVAVQGYQVVKYKEWRFGSTKTKRQFEDLSDQVGNDIADVFSFMGDAISASAEALAVPQERVERFFEEFRIKTEKLSLKGLSAKEQQKELEAYFSDAFDDMALAFDVAITGGISKFIQDIDESAGEAFTRMVTQTSVLDQAVKDFNLNFGKSISDLEQPNRADFDSIYEYRKALNELFVDRNNFIYAADAMAELTGGLDNFIEQLNGFVSFASDAKQLEILGGRLESRFSDMNLALPDTADGMWNLIQTLDGTTEAGREQIAMILGLQDSAKAYYQLLERENNRLLDERKSQLAEALNVAREQYEAEKERINLLKEGVNDEIEALKEQKSILDENLTEAESAVESAYSSEIEAIRSASQERINQLNKERQAVTDNLNLVTSIVNSAQNAISSVYSSPDSIGQSLDAAISAAQRGNFNPASNVDFGGAFRSSESFATESDFLLAQAETANKIQMLGELAGEQKSIEQHTLDSIDAQVQATKEQTERQIDALEQQKRSLLGIEDSTLSIYEANEQYRAAKSALDRLQFDSTMSYYESELAKFDSMLESNQEVFDLHKENYEKLIEAIESGNTETQELNEWLKDNYQGAPTLSDRDLVHVGEPVTDPALSNLRDKSNKELIAEIRKLREEQQIANAALADNTNRTAKELQDIKFNGLETQ